MAQFNMVDWTNQMRKIHQIQNSMNAALPEGQNKVMADPSGNIYEMPHDSLGNNPNNPLMPDPNLRTSFPRQIHGEIDPSFSIRQQPVHGAIDPNFSMNQSPSIPEAPAPVAAPQAPVAQQGAAIGPPQQFTPGQGMAGFSNEVRGALGLAENAMGPLDVRETVSQGAGKAQADAQQAALQYLRREKPGQVEEPDDQSLQQVSQLGMSGIFGGSGDAFRRIAKKGERDMKVPRAQFNEALKKMDTLGSELAKDKEAALESKFGKENKARGEIQSAWEEYDDFAKRSEERFEDHEKEMEKQNRIIEDMEYEEKYDGIDAARARQLEKVAEGDPNLENRIAAKERLRKAKDAAGIDPWKKFGVWQKLGIALMQGLGAAAAAFSKSPNSTGKIIEGILDTEIMKQRSARQQASRKISREESRLAKYDSKFRSKLQAELQWKKDWYQRYMTKISETAKLMTDPEKKAQLKMIHAETERKSLEVQARKSQEDARLIAQGTRTSLQAEQMAQNVEQRKFDLLMKHRMSGEADHKDAVQLPYGVGWDHKLISKERSQGRGPERKPYIDKDQSKNIVKYLNGWQRVKYSATRLIDLIKDNGMEVPWSEARAEMEALRKDLVISEKDVAALGVLSKWDISLLEELIGESGTISVKGYTAMTRIQAFLKAAENTVKESMQRHWLTMNPEFELRYDEKGDAVGLSGYDEATKKKLGFFNRYIGKEEAAREKKELAQEFTQRQFRMGGR